MLGRPPHPNSVWPRTRRTPRPLRPGTGLGHAQGHGTETAAGELLSARCSRCLRVHRPACIQNSIRWRLLRDGFELDDDPARSTSTRYLFLSEESYWAQGRPRQIVEWLVREATRRRRPLRPDGRQPGFARARSRTGSPSRTSRTSTCTRRAGTGSASSSCGRWSRLGRSPASWPPHRGRARLYERVGFGRPSRRLMEREARGRRPRASAPRLTIAAKPASASRGTPAAPRSDPGSSGRGRRPGRRGSRAVGRAGAAVRHVQRIRHPARPGALELHHVGLADALELTDIFWIGGRYERSRVRLHFHVCREAHLARRCSRRLGS